MDFQRKPSDHIFSRSEHMPSLKDEGTNELDNLKNVPQIIKGSPTAETEPHTENLTRIVTDQKSETQLDEHIDQPPEIAPTE